MVILKMEKLTIYEVESLHKKLLVFIEKYDQIDLDMQNIQKIDMPGIQLLLSTSLTCKAKSKKFSLNNITEPVLESLQLCKSAKLLGVKI